MDEPLITVSMPFYGTHKYVRQAVDSVLAQTYKNLKLVVVNDGDPEPPWKLLEDIDDPRLVRFDSGINRGPYFCHEIVRRCSDSSLSSTVMTQHILDGFLCCRKI